VLISQVRRNILPVNPVSKIKMISTFDKTI
jgi:hypothetical protein